MNRISRFYRISAAIITIVFFIALKFKWLNFILSLAGRLTRVLTSESSSEVPQRRKTRNKQISNANAIALKIGEGVEKCGDGTESVEKFHSRSVERPSGNRNGTGGKPPIRYRKDGVCCRASCGRCRAVWRPATCCRPPLRGRGGSAPPRKRDRAAKEAPPQVPPDLR